jgi:hypothetical protein
MEWFGASVIAPRENAAIEFELAGERAPSTGSYRDATFFDGRDTVGYPRRLVRRWRYASASASDACGHASDSGENVAIADVASCE